MTFNEALKNSGLSVKEAAEICGVSWRTIYNWLDGTHKARQVYIGLIANYKPDS